MGDEFAGSCSPVAFSRRLFVLELAASIGPVFPIDGNLVYGCLTVVDCFVSLGSGGPDEEEGGCTSGKMEGKVDMAGIGEGHGIQSGVPFE